MTAALKRQLSLPEPSPKRRKGWRPTRRYVQELERQLLNARATIEEQRRTIERLRAAEGSRK